jgi:hypothetical protein
MTGSGERRMNRKRVNDEIPEQYTNIKARYDERHM